MERQGQPEISDFVEPSPSENQLLTPDELATLRQFFEVLDAWDRKETEKPR